MVIIIFSLTCHYITITRIYLGHDVKGLKIDLFYYAEDVDSLMG